MARVAVLSDTHSYDDLRETVPGWVRAEVESADDTLHAGDFATPTALAFFRELAAELVAVRGNADVGVDLPEVATLTVEGVRLVVTHPPDVADASLDRGAYDRAVLAAVGSAGNGRSAGGGQPVVAVAGHTHRVIDDVVGGVRLLTPGSATAWWTAERPTMLRLRVTGGTVDVTVLDPEDSESDAGE